MCKHENLSSPTEHESADNIYLNQGRNYRNELIADLVSENPIRACVFEEYRIDFCCGGRITLEDLCSRGGLNLAELESRLAAIDARQPAQTDWKRASLADLIRHIIGAYHEPLRQQLQYVTRLAEKVARVHGEKHKEMVALKNLFSYFRSELETHMQKEEVILFPAIIAIENREPISSMSCVFNLQMPISVMLQEHEQAEAMLTQFRQLTHDYIPPEGACHSFRVLLFLLHTIETDLHRHVHLESNILFPRVIELQKGLIHSH